MRVKPTLLLLALALMSGLAAPARAAPEKVCPTPEQSCDNSGTVILETEARRCSPHRFTLLAAICHSVNMAHEG